MIGVVADDTTGALDIGGLKGFRLIAEIATGVPACCAADRKLVVILKSGSCGAPDFFLQAGARAIALRDSMASLPA